MAFYGYNRPGAKIRKACENPSGTRECRGINAVFGCVKAFSETNFTEDLQKFDVPTLVMHGDDDQKSFRSRTRVAFCKIIKGRCSKCIRRSHGLCTTHKNQVNRIWLAFIKGLRAPRPIAAGIGPRLDP